MPKIVKRDLLGFLKIQFVAKYQKKNKRGAFQDTKIL